eukprot:242651-Prymnesium_polylepis.1
MWPEPAMLVNRLIPIPYVPTTALQQADVVAASEREVRGPPPDGVGRGGKVCAAGGGGRRGAGSAGAARGGVEWAARCGAGRSSQRCRREGCGVRMALGCGARASLGRACRRCPSCAHGCRCGTGRVEVTIRPVARHWGGADGIHDAPPQPISRQ